MSEFTINVVQDPSTIIDINNSNQTVSLNILEDQYNSIQVNDNSNDVLLNPSVFYNGINIVYLSGVSGELLHNTFGDLQGGSTGQYYHLSSGQYFNLITGAVVRPNETGSFLTIGSADLRYIGLAGDQTISGAKAFVLRPSVNGTGVMLSGEAVSVNTGELTGAFYPLNSNPSNYVTGSVVRPSETGVFYPTSNPSGYITGVDLSAYVTGNVVRPSETGNFVTASQTGAFYPRSNPSGFISPSQTGAFYAASNPSGFITGVDLSAYVTGEVVRPSQTGVFYPTSNPSGYVTGSVVRPSETGSFITTAQTGAFYPVSNPSGYVTGSVVRPSETGNFITQSQTGAFYPNSNPSGYISSDGAVALTNKTINGANNTITNVSILTGVSGLASGVATFLAAPTSSNLAAAVADETGTGALVFANTPTLITPNIGAATGDSLNVTGNLTASGTASSLPNQTLLAADDTRILTKKTSARDDMWSSWQKKQILSTTTSSVGTSYTANGNTMVYNVICGTSAIGRAGAFGETGMTVNPGQGAGWYIPSSFAVAFGFYSLMVNNTLTSNNITNGVSTFTVSTSNHNISVGHRIWSSAFPEETYVSAVSGTSVTATRPASSTPATPHTVVFSPDQISRVVLGTSNLIGNYILECPNARDSFLTPVGAAIGATSLQINSNIVSTGVVNMWSGQPYFILTTTNASISNANGTTFYAACSNFPVSATALSVLRCDNATGTPTTTTGTWTGPGTNQIVVGVANNIIGGQTVSGLGIPQNTTVQSVSGTTITLNQMITSSGSGVALYFGYQRIYVDQNATATATGQGCGFIAKNVSGSYAYGRGIIGGTTITNIINGPISGFNLVISNALTKAYVAGVPIAINLTTGGFTGNSCIFMDFGADPSDGYLKVRLGYMKDGVITYSAWTSFPKGNIPHAAYQYYYQGVIDYNASTDKLRLFADRNGDIVTNYPKDFPKPPSTPTITLTGVSPLNDKQCGIYFGTHIYGNAVNTLSSVNIATLAVRQLVYYPYQTFID